MEDQNFSFGPGIEVTDIRQTKGCGISFQIIDIDRCGRPEIIAPGKDGLVMYKILGFAENMEKPW